MGERIPHNFEHQDEETVKVVQDPIADEAPAKVKPLPPITNASHKAALSSEMLLIRLSGMDDPLSGIAILYRRGVRGIDSNSINLSNSAKLKMGSAMRVDVRIFPKQMKPSTGNHPVCGTHGRDQILRKIASEIDG